MSNPCPENDELRALLSVGDGEFNGGESHDGRTSAVERHVESCLRCQARLHQLSGGDAFVPSVPRPPSLGDWALVVSLTQSMHALRRDGSPPLTAHDVADTRASPDDRGPPARVDEQQWPRRIGEYEIKSVLGQGGIGVVYRGTDAALRRDVAIKVLRPAYADQPPMRERFLREAQAAAALRHDHVVAVYAVGEFQRQPYLVMEYVPGGSLADRLERDARLAVADVVRLGIAVASALAAAHAKGIVHRDVKPGNILWDETVGRYKLADFGLAKTVDEVSLTRSGIVVGTPEFLSPEQANGKPLDARSDLFSLGAVLFAALDGQSPFRSDSTLGSLQRVCHFTPPDVRSVRADCPARLAEIIARLLAKEPAERHVSASDVAAELAKIDVVEAGQFVAARLDSSDDRVATPTSKRRQLAGGLLLGVAIVAGITWYAQGNGEADLNTLNISPPVSPSIAGATGPFVVAGTRFDTLAAAVAAAPAGGTIEVRGSERIAIAPITLRGKAVTIRAADGDRPILVSRDESGPSGPVIETDASLTLDNLQIQRPAAATDDDESTRFKRSGVLATGGTLRLDRCEITVGKDLACVAIVGADGDIKNSRLSARQGICVGWRPLAAGGGKLVCEYSVLTGACGVFISSDLRTRGALPATLEMERNTWRGEKAIEFLLANGPQNSVEIRTSRNQFGVSHALTVFWMHRGQRGHQRPDMPNLRRMIAGRLIWHERENVYAATCRFLAWRSPVQPLAAVDSSPRTIAQWEALWNNMSSGSRLDSDGDGGNRNAGADELLVGPRRNVSRDTTSAPP